MEVVREHRELDEYRERERELDGELRELEEEEGAERSSWLMGAVSSVAGTVAGTVVIGGRSEVGREYRLDRVMRDLEADTETLSNEILSERQDRTRTLLQLHL